MNTYRSRLHVFRTRRKPVDYYKAFVQADRDKYYWHGQEWVATKRALKAEAEVRRLKQEIRDLRNQHELLFPRA